MKDLFFPVRVILCILALQIFVFIPSQYAQRMERKNPEPQININSRAEELGIKEEMLNLILSSVKSDGKEKEDPVPDATIKKHLTGEAAGDQFGYSVSSAGDFNGDGYEDIIIGAYLNDAGGTDAGKAWVFCGGLTFDDDADVTFVGAATLDYFGYSVSAAGDVNGDSYDDVIIGACYNDGGGSDAGRAYIYYGGPIMNNAADVILTGVSTSDLFGWTVSGAGDVNGDGFSDVIVGAPLNETMGTDAGQAYIYYGGSSMNNTVDVTLTALVTGDLFGSAVSDAGDVNGDGFDDVIIGAYHNDFSGSNAGRAYVYFGGVSMNNTPDVYTAGDAANDYFGYSVSAAGDVNNDGYDDFLVGAYGSDVGGTNIGRAYVYHGGSYVNSNPDVIISGVLAYGFLGYSVSSAGDVNADGFGDVIVGAYGTGTGRAFVYFGSPSMDKAADMVMTGEALNDFFGVSVACAGDLNGDGIDELIAGAVGNDAGGSSAGRVYLYFNSMTGNDIPDEIFTGAAADDNFGLSVSMAGDVNGDGYNDIIIGAPGNDASAISAGRAYIFLGGPLLDNTADVILSGDGQTTGRFGYSVAAAGDVNNDGFDDVVASAPYTDYGGTNAGTAYIYLGGNPMNNGIDFYADGAPEDNLGTSVSTAGDINGDGYDDIIVGAPNNDAGGTDFGTAYIFFGGTTLNNVPDVIFTGESESDLFGNAVSRAGDVNGDGYSDVIVGAFIANAGTVKPGRAYIYYGGISISNDPAVTLTGESDTDYFGGSVSTAGDVNNDGYDDVIVGAPLYKYSDWYYVGRAYIYLGGIQMNNTVDVIITGSGSYDVLGTSVSTAGDVNKDGFDDAAVGAQGAAGKGQVFIYFGGSNMNNAADIVMTGESTTDLFGTSVSSADISGDGYSDIITGAYMNDAGGTNAGSAYLFLSSSPAVTPCMISVKDIPFDQGGYVKLKWMRSGFDVQGTSLITEYLIQRSDPPGENGFAWENIGAMTASNEPFYSYTAETPNDSMTNNSGTYYFRITARTSNTNQYWRSNILSGHSVDNLAPAVPVYFYAVPLSGQVKLGWRANSESDLKNYLLYRTNDPGINPDLLPVFAATTDTIFIDTAPLSGTAFYYLKAQDVHSNLSPFVSASLSAQTFALAVSVIDGWNMVSIPGLHPTNQNIDTWWSSRSPGVNVFKYTGTYQAVTTVAPGSGYWMRHSGTKTYNTGDEWPAILIVSHDPITAASGWNLIGGYEYSAAASGITTTPPGLQVGIIYGYSGSYQPAENLIPGYGYWIRLSGAGQINLPPSGFQENSKIANFIKEDWGRITFTDYSGKSFILYAVKGHVNLNDYELPPKLLPGMFDIRFGSGRIAEYLNTGFKSIEMQGLYYPVKVHIDNINLILRDETENLNIKLLSGQEIILSEVNTLMVSEEITPVDYSLEQNYPNPFNPVTKINYGIADRNNVRLSVMNAIGEEVAVLVNGENNPGYHTVEFNASNIPSGVYFYRITAGKFVCTKKMMLIK